MHIGVVTLGRVGAVGIRKGWTRRIHIIGTALIPVEDELHTTLKHTEVQTRIHGLGCFPGEVIRNLAGNRGVAHTADTVQRAAPFARTFTHIAEIKFLHKSVGGDATVAQFAEGAAYLEAGNPLGIYFPPVFLGYAPGGRGRREETPLAIGWELGGTVVTAVHLEEVTLVVGVVETKHKTGNAPAAGVGGNTHIIAHCEVDVVRIVSEQVIAFGRDGFPGLPFVVVSCHCLEVVLVGKGIFILRIGVGSDVVRLGEVFLQVIVHLWSTQPGNLAGRRAVWDACALLELVLVTVRIGKIGVQAEGIVEEVRLEAGSGLVVADRAVFIVLPGYEATYGVGAGHRHGPVRVENRGTDGAGHIDGGPEVSGVLFVGTGRNVVELVVEGYILRNLEPGAKACAHFRPQVHGVVLVRAKVEQSVVLEETAGNIVIHVLGAAADRDVVGLGGRIILIEEIVVVRVAVVDILTVRADFGCALDAGKFALAELLKPLAGEVLHLVDRGLILAGHVVVSLVEQRSIDITVRNDVRDGGGGHNR